MKFNGEPAPPARAAVKLLEEDQEPRAPSKEQKYLDHLGEPLNANARTMPGAGMWTSSSLKPEVFEKLTFHRDWHSMEASQLTESSVLLSCFFNKSSNDGNKSQVNLTDSTVINHHSCLAILHIKTKRFLFCQYRTSPLSFKFINHSPSWGQTWGKYEPPILNKQFGHNSPLARVFNHR